MMSGQTEESVIFGEGSGRLVYVTAGGGIGRVSGGLVDKEGWSEELSPWNTELSPCICR